MVRELEHLSCEGRLKMLALFGEDCMETSRHVQYLEGPVRKPERDSSLGTVEVGQEGMASN